MNKTKYVVYIKQGSFWVKAQTVDNFNLAQWHADNYIKRGIEAKVITE